MPRIGFDSIKNTSGGRVLALYPSVVGRKGAQPGPPCMTVDSQKNLIAHSPLLTRSLADDINSSLIPALCMICIICCILKVS